MTYYLKRNITFIILFAFMLALNSCATKEKVPVGTEITMDKTSFSEGRIQYPFDLFPEYLMQPGDVLDVLFQIRTWLERDKFKLAIDHVVNIKFVHASELNEKQLVRPDGTIALPYIGDIHVVGKTTAELTADLNKRYKNILVNPDIYVVVPEFRSRIKELKKDLHTAPRGLSRLVTVRPDGFVTFPMIGDVFVVNRTLPEVNEELNEKYEKILPSLHVDLFLEKHSGSVIYVLGEVEKPGPYQIVKPLTVLEALSLAGSFVPGAKISSIVVVRKTRGEKKIVATKVDLKKTLTLESKQNLFYLQPDDIVYVPKTTIKVAAEVMRDIADIVLFNGWGIGFGFSWELHREPVPESRTEPSTTVGVTTTAP